MIKYHNFDNIILKKTTKNNAVNDNTFIHKANPNVIKFFVNKTIYLF